jgi:hypothetical protein
MWSGLTGFKVPVCEVVRVRKPTRILRQALAASPAYGHPLGALELDLAAFAWGHH